MKKFFIFPLVVAVMVMTLAVGFGSAEAADKVYKWDMTYPLYRGTWDWAVLEKWCDDLRAASGGRLDITPHAGGEIMPVMETFDAVSSGTLKIDFSYGPYWIGKLPMAIYASGLPPFTLPRWEHYKVLYYELGLEKLLREAYAKHNIFYVATIPTNNAVMLSKFPVNKIADLKGKKFRATGLYAEVLNAAGASATYFPWGKFMEP
jgi:TRAP-type mannitol/chloroaromatic compound transport system substrate-binding protein